VHPLSPPPAALPAASPPPFPAAPARLRLDGAALVANWRRLRALGGAAACGAAVKADGYGLGATEVVRRLAAAGARDFFVATWAEAAALAPLGLPVSVLHGVRDEDMGAARHLAGIARPVLNTQAQVARWRAAGGGPCDVMVDTGINRLGVSADEVRGGLLDGLVPDTVMSHLARADEDCADNARQAGMLATLRDAVPPGTRLSLANSAGVALGRDWAFDLTRPGLALYGGRPRAGLEGIAQVAFPQAQVLQRRRVPAGGAVGYNAAWTAGRDTDVAVLNLGYADGYRRAFTNAGAASWGGVRLPVIGRVSMDLTALDATDAAGLAEGDWVDLDYDLDAASAASGISAYELLTGLGARWERAWI